MANAVKAGATYFAIVFGFAFLIGTVRVLVVAPRLGDAPAVMLEAPAVLLFSWFVCSWCRTLYRLAHDPRTGLLMGAFAFGLLMAGELGVSFFLFKRSIAAYFATYATASGMIGFLGQLAFAAIPVIQARRPTSPDDGKEGGTRSQYR
jgi:hypothetical protein